MKNGKKYVWSRWIAAIAVLIVLVGMILYTVDQKELMTWFLRNWSIVAGALTAIVAALGFAFQRRRPMQLALQRASREQGAEPSGPVDTSIVAAQKRAEQTVAHARRLKRFMKQKRWFRAAYAQPWILVTGHSATVSALMPNLAQEGWLATDDAVLLWGGLGAEDDPDELWLRQIRRLRRDRPLDAIALLPGDTILLSHPGEGSHRWGLRLARIAEILHWSAPVFVLDIDGTDPVHRTSTPVTGCEFTHPLNASAAETALQELRDKLADRSVHQLANNDDDLYASKVSARLDHRSPALARWIASLADWQRRPLPIAGIFFAPLPAIDGGVPASSSDHANLPLWGYLAEASKRTPGRRTLSHPLTISSITGLTLIAVWTAGMLISGMNNAREVLLTNRALTTLKQASDTSSRLRALLALQHRIGLHEARAEEHKPLLTRFGLNHDRAVLKALWSPYARAARPLLVAPVQQDIEGQLVDLGQMSTVQVDEQSSQVAQQGQQALKTYLMMAEPQRADPAFMTPHLEQHWNLDSGLPFGEKLDLSAQLLGFWAQHFPAHSEWRIEPREELVGNARQTLLAIIGVKNSEDTIYQGVLEAVGRKYPNQSLASLTAGTDTRGLFSTSATVPGVFTRQAWEGTIESAIDSAAKRNGVVADWVLGSAGGPQGEAASQAMTPDALRDALRRHYFSDYAEHWQAFMNGIRSDAAPTLPAAVGQLRLIADARQSPLIALMKSLAWQGGAGAEQASLSDALVTRAQNLLGKKDNGPQAAQTDPAGPLGASFGPVLKLVAQGNGNAAPAAGSELSLERFTERVTSLRLKLQQISDSADPDDQARQVAQSLFQGKSSDLSDTLAYAQLIAASLGEQWAGMGGALFVRPIEQATQTVLAPAQASLNDAWRQTVVAAWNRSFAGRYPFADTANDASLPELARFLRPQGGLISTFLSTQLAGALQLQGDQWVPASGGTGAGGTARSFDPAFLDAINKLQLIAGHLLAQGEPQYVFGLKPVPTPGVTDTLLTLDGQTLHYYNQQESWQTLTWPSAVPQNAGTRLEWQTEQAGTNRNFEFSGRWALLRMLERASVEPVDSATLQLTWFTKPDSVARKPVAAAEAAKAADPAALNNEEPATPPPPNLTHPLRYLIRTDVGKGPLELIALRGFTLPSQIFAGRNTPAVGGVYPKEPPPLPKAARDAASKAAVPVPQGQAPTYE